MSCGQVYYLCLIDDVRKIFSFSFNFFCSCYFPSFYLYSIFLYTVYLYGSCSFRFSTLYYGYRISSYFYAICLFRSVVFFFCFALLALAGCSFFVQNIPFINWDKDKRFEKVSSRRIFYIPLLSFNNSVLFCVLL